MMHEDTNTTFPLHRTRDGLGFSCSLHFNSWLS